MTLLFTREYLTIIKFLAIINTVMYLFYSKKNKMLHILYFFMFFNIFIAILQFLFIYIDYNISYAIGPSNIANLLWGKYATPTYTNFYAIFLFPRVSGLSREAGFFASLLGITYIIYISDQHEKKTKLKNVMFFIGFILSLSKASLLIIGIIIVIKLKRLINKIPFFIGIILFISVFIFISNNILLNKYYDFTNQSITHRLSGYTIMTKMPLKELIIGKNQIKDISVFPKYSFLNFIVQFKKFTGIPNIIIHNGIIVSIIFFIMLYAEGIYFSGFLIITLLTFTTDYFTCTSFVVLGYFYVFYNKRFTNNVKLNLKT